MVVLDISFPPYTYIVSHLRYTVNCFTHHEPQETEEKPDKTTGKLAETGQKL
jgi:hypothetical protein